MRRILSTITFAAVMAAAPSWACSPPVIRIPKDIVTSAQVIVRARALSEDNTSAEITSEVSSASRHVLFSIVSVLKRTINEQVIRIPGYLEERDDWNANLDSMPNRMSRPGFIVGSCYALNYRQGADYLLLLGPTPQTGSLTPYWASLAATNEQLR